MNPRVEVYDVWAEDLFEWFTLHICNSGGGDGAGAICCENYRDVADWFAKWFKNRYPKGCLHPKSEYVCEGKSIINFNNGNENFIFCDSVISLGYGDVTFIVRQDCVFGSEPTTNNKVIMAVNMGMDGLMKYRLKEDTTHLSENFTKGDVVIRHDGYDYGLCRDDEAYFGEPFIMVVREGGIPSTCPVRLLEAV